jgi:hypothetical protein
MNTEKLYTEEQLREAFYTSIAYWSPKYGWEEAAFEHWKGGMLYREQEIAKFQTSEEALGYGIVAVPTN